jgi:hypothetical protein
MNSLSSELRFPRDLYLFQFEASNTFGRTFLNSFGLGNMQFDRTGWMGILSNLIKEKYLVTMSLKAMKSSQTFAI